MLLLGWVTCWMNSPSLLRITKPSDSASRRPAGTNRAPGIETRSTTLCSANLSETVQT